MLAYLVRHRCFSFKILLGDPGKRSQSSMHLRLCTSFLPSAKHRLGDNLARTVWCTPCIAGLLKLNPLPLEKGAPVRRSSLPIWGHTNNALQLSFSKPFVPGCSVHDYTPGLFTIALPFQKKQNKSKTLKKKKRRKYKKRMKK